MRQSSIAVSCAVFATAVPLLALLTPGVAIAAEQRAHYYAATSICEAPLPVYDATLRKRPLGIANEGESTIFISCSMPGDIAGDRASATVQINFTSMGGTGEVTCTLVGGNRPWGSTAVAGTVAVAAGQNAQITWQNVDKNNTWGSYNFSCNVLPGIEMNHITVVQYDTFGGL